MPQKKRSGLIILLILVAVFIVLSLLFFLTFDKTSTKPDDKFFEFNSNPLNFTFSTNQNNTEFLPNFSEYIGVIYVEGTIQEKNKTYDHEFLLNTIYKLKKDKKNLGLMVFIDSPGGTVYHSDELYLSLRDYSKTGKPVWAYMGSMACSGGYYIACGAEKIICNRNCLTGSIGVIAGQSVDLTELMAKYGIKMTTITAGKNKNMLNLDSPMTEEHKEIMQSIADEAYEQFTGIVSGSRGLTLAKTKELADGRIYTAKQALENGLVDHIATFDLAMENFITELSDDKKDVQVKYFQQKQSTTFGDFFMEKIKDFQPKSEFESIKNAVNQIALPEDLDFPAYYFKK